MRNIDTIVIHHSVTDKFNKDIWAESVDGKDYVPGLYIDGKEYKGNYHYMIYWDGEIKNPVPDDRYTYNCGVYNINLTSIAICFIGDYSSETPSKEALVSARKVVEELKSKYQINNIYGHKELYQTACPGSWWNINLIMEAQMNLTFEQVRRGYLAILRREPDGGQKNVYVGSPISLEQFYCELGDSQEHIDRYNDSEKYRSGENGNIKYEKVNEDLYKIKK